MRHPNLYATLSFKYFKPLDKTLIDVVNLPSSMGASILCRTTCLQRFLEYERSSLFYKDYTLEDWFGDRDSSFLKHPQLLELHRPEVGLTLHGTALYEVFKVCYNNLTLEILNKDKLQETILKIPNLSIDDLKEMHRNSLRTITSWNKENSYENHLSG